VLASSAERGTVHGGLVPAGRLCTVGPDKAFAAKGSAVAAGIFISYRRDDSRHVAGRLADDLAQAFGPESIFRDIEGISLGLDFTQSLDAAMAACSVMLVLIGPNWLTIQNAQGQRRLDQPEDWIRQEIATALRRNVRVVRSRARICPMLANCRMT